MDPQTATEIRRRAAECGVELYYANERGERVDWPEPDPGPPRRYAMADLAMTYLRDEGGSHVIRVTEKVPHRPDRGPLHGDMSLSPGMVESLDPVRFAPAHAAEVERTIVRGFDDMIAAEIAAGVLIPA